ncbi:MAG: recombination-associated protein RdgC [Spongiibacter sp.]|nr:recombination-associated protein RdgC [Spongiibacter sp.]
MWFKNILLYRFTRPFTTSIEELNEKLEASAFSPCGSQDQLSYGWVKPLGDNGSEYLHVCNGYIMLCAKQQEKVLPAAVVNEFLDEKIREIQDQDGRKPGRKERTEIKEQIVFELLPRAFSRSKKLYAYIDVEQGLLYVDSSSYKRAEDLLGLLRDTLGSLPVIPVKAKNTAQHMLSDWVKNVAPQGFEVGGECELRDSADETAVIRAKNQDLSSEQIQSHLSAGMYVSKLAMTWTGGIDFVVDDQLAIKRVQFGDLIRDKADDINAESAAEQFDADFSIMSGEFARFIPAVLDAFGGEDLSDVAGEAETGEQRLSA